MPRLKCLSALASIKCQIAIFGLTNRRHHPRRQFGSWGLSARSGGKSLIYDSLRRRKGGSRLKLAQSVFSLPRSSCVDLGAKPTLTSMRHATGFRSAD
jgi:hypothetical protein